MRTLNSVVLVGTVGADPTFRPSTRGLTCELSLGVREVVRTARGDTVHVEWVTVRLGARAAALCERTVRRGRLLGVEGRLRCRTAHDAHGRARKEIYVQAHRVHLLDGPSPDAPGAARRPGERPHPAFRRPAQVRVPRPADPPAEAVGDGAQRPLRAG